MKIDDGQELTQMSLKDIEGTDLDLIRSFVNRHKLRGAILIYLDDEGLNAVKWTRKGSGKLRNLWKSISRLIGS